VDQREVGGHIARADDPLHRHALRVIGLGRGPIPARWRLRGPVEGH
jgi:hypothetical protein